MNKLLEIAVKNSVSNSDDTQFRPASLFQRSIPDSFRDSDIEEIPIKPDDPTWETVSSHDKTFITKKFVFHANKHLMYFLNETITKSEYMQHHPKLIVEGNIIVAEIYTHDINDVSGLDLELARHMDEIYSDIVFISRI